MAMSEDISKKNEGIYRWTSEPDHDGDVVAVQNCRGYDGVVVMTGKPGKLKSGLVSGQEAFELAMAILDLREDRMPRTIHQEIDTETGETR